MIKSLEGGRGLAALIVALYHLKLGADYFPFIRNGYLFVDLFFVLSGFVICAAYSTRMNDREDLRAFIIRRAGRLVPLLLFSTVVFVLTADAIVLAKRFALAHGYADMLNNPGALDYVVPTASEILATLTLTHGLGLFDRLILNTPSWSISVEFYTYLLFAAACLLFKGKARLAAFGALSVIGFAVSVYASLQVHGCLQNGGCLGLDYDFGYPRAVFSFFLGALAYHAAGRRRFDSALLPLAALIALSLLLSIADAHPAAAFGIPFVFAALILSVCQDRGWLAAILKTRPLQMLGRRSYSIYLMHMPLLLIFENIAKRVNGVMASTLVVLAFVAVLLVISGWTYRYIEDPFRAWFNRLAGKKPAAPRAGDAAASAASPGIGIDGGSRRSMQASAPLHGTTSVPHAGYLHPAGPHEKRRAPDELG